MALNLNKRGLQKCEDGRYKFIKPPVPEANGYTENIDTPTSFNLSAITLEDIDKAVWQEFNHRFRLMDRELSLYSGDADINSLPQMNWDNFDPEKGFLAWPFFIYTRTETKKMYRTNPTYKPIRYVVPKKKPQGIVLEAYISEGPVSYELIYEFKVVTYFREACNQFEEQINHYFRNRRNIILVDQNKFSIGPVNRDEICSLDIVSRDAADQTTMYVLTVQMKMWCFTRRGVEDMQKKELPSSFTLDIVVSDSVNKNVLKSKDTIQIEEYIVDNKVNQIDQNSYLGNS